MYYVGLDLHKRYVTACALDSVGQVVAAKRRSREPSDSPVTRVGSLLRIDARVRARTQRRVKATSF